MLRRVTFRSVMIAIVCAISISAIAMADPPRKVDVPSGDLATALQKLAEQSGVEFIYSVDQLKGIHTGGVHGEYTTEQAVIKLLEGTKLKLTVHKSGAILIAPPNPNTLSEESGSPVVGHRTGTESASNPPPADRLQLAQSGAGSNPQDASMSMDAQASSKTLEDDDELAEIVVTGSRLRTTEAATASPVTVITQDEIKKMGFSTAEDVIRSLPQNYGSLNAGTTRDPLSPFTQDAQGQSAADLRGLGPENTLVLVNGRRRAVSSTFGDVVNLNTIPVGSIDRIEIMTDGASAVYGSDAVGGVINFILKKDYQGGETHVRQELGANGGDATSLEQTLGDSWSSGNVTFSGRFAKSDPADSIRPGYTTANLTRRGGDDWRNFQEGQPGVVQGFGALPPGDNGTNGIAGKLSPANVVPYDSAANPSDLLAGQKHYSIDINAEQNLSSWARAYGEFSFAKNTSEATNGAPDAYFVTVPATNRFNDLGQPLTVGYVFLNEVQQGLLPAQLTTSDQRALGGVLGVKITFPEDWTLDISANHSREDASFNSLRIDPTILAERLSGFDVNGKPIPANQQLNLFGNGTAQNPAALAGLMHWGIPGFYINDNFSTSDSGLLTTEGSLLKLPGGDMRLAAGGEFRREELSYTDVGNLSNLLIANPSRTVKAAFGEMNIPLVGEHNRVPGVYSLNAYGAGRWEQYSIKGPFDGTGAPDRTETFSQTSPKVGFSWYPWQELKVRGTFSKSFRAPQLSDLFATTGGPYNYLPIVDPNNPGQGTIYPNAYQTGNPHLGPETANNYTGGLDWKPRGTLSGLAVTLTYSQIDFANRIASAFDYYGTPLFYTLPGVIVRDASGNIVAVNFTKPVNIASRRSDSADALVSYGMDTRAGQLTFGVSGTYAIKLEDSPGPGLPSLVLAGTQNGPERIKARAWTSWSRQNYGLNLYANYSSSYTNTNIYSPSLLAPQSVDHYTTFDLNGFYNLPGGFSINAGARNLTNAAFPFFNSRAPWDSRRVDLRGRILYLEFTSKYKL
jgi:iron complex outermembrane recepter protein